MNLCRTEASRILHMSLTAFKPTKIERKRNFLLRYDQFMLDLAYVVGSVRSFFSLDF